jgi:hypothetical protein
MAMGILADVRREASSCIAVFTVVFWIAIGAGIGSALADAFYWGAAIGFCIAFYAVTAGSKIALALSMPGVLFGLVVFMLTAAS